MDTQVYKEVHFHEYCVTCEHRNVANTDEPCCACLDEPLNWNSHKPVKYEKSEKGRSKK